ncbi:hypothetical protein Scep_002324 [Stephania cephalantha]|uniref:Caffeoyl-CoA O-methyltransferase n=1 Tax=Stephania cephalantha TaxID=152367 RepID=A0AAP0LB04_9MAGN
MNYEDFRHIASVCTEQIRPKCRRFFSPSNFMKFEKDESGIIAILPFYLYVMRTGDEFDFVFVDADKPNYIKYHEILVKLVKVGGLIGYDNTLWFKCVALPDEEVPEYMMKNRNALKELNSYLASDARIEISNIMHLVWDAGAGRRLHTFEGHESPVYSVCPHYKENIQFIFSRT